jgi:hypothetical protein
MKISSTRASFKVLGIVGALISGEFYIFNDISLLLI